MYIQMGKNMYTHISYAYISRRIIAPEYDHICVQMYLYLHNTRHVYVYAYAYVHVCIYIVCMHVSPCPEHERIDEQLLLQPC